MERRRFVQSLVALTAAGGLGLFGGARRLDAATFGQLLPPDANGLRLPAGFSSRIVATTGQIVPGTNFTWHPNPDGGATFPTPSGGWIYVSNSESLPADGGASALEFDSAGTIIDARRILSGTLANCAGGPMPWGTWLSCEEYPFGQVWECDPSGQQQAVARPAMGRFNHEAAAADPNARAIYLTEDRIDGGLYRFLPTIWGNLSTGLLQVMTESPSGVIGFSAVPDPTGQAQPTPTETRYQVPAMKEFQGGEGAWFADGVLYFATKFDNRVWTYTPATNSLEIIYDGSAPGSILTGVDNLAAGPGGEVFVCEDGGNMEVVVLSADGSVAPFLQITGAPNSEVTGVSFDPSGTRMYVSSQRSPGVTYEITGPFAVVPMCDGQPVDVDIAAGDSPTAGDDVILGTSGADTIDGGLGDDVICGGDGDDTLIGGAGDDRIFGDAGKDEIYGDDGRDRIRGGADVDTIHGGKDIDRIWGDGGNDVIAGDGGSDRIRAGSGNDTVNAGSGADRVWGDAGDDTINGQGGQDVLLGGAGADTIQGNHQSDEIRGEDGDDTLRGAEGKDRLYGGSGDDDLFGGANTDYLDGGAGTDTANGQAGRERPFVVDESGCVAESTVNC